MTDHLRMAVSVARLPRPRINGVLNALIGILLIVDALVGVSVLNQFAENDGVQPLLTAPPEPVATTTIPAPVDTDTPDVGAASVASLEQMQSAVVAARSLQVQNDRPIEASDLAGAMPSLTFVNGFTAAGDGVIGVTSDENGFLLLTQDGASSWLCAGTDAAGISVVATAAEKEPVSTFAGCQANGD